MTNVKSSKRTSRTPRRKHNACHLHPVVVAAHCLAVTWAAYVVLGQDIQTVIEVPDVPPGLAPPAPDEHAPDAIIIADHSPPISSGISPLKRGGSKKRSLTPFVPQAQAKPQSPQLQPPLQPPPSEPSFAPIPLAPLAANPSGLPNLPAAMVPPPPGPGSGPESLFPGFPEGGYPYAPTNPFGPGAELVDEEYLEFSARPIPADAKKRKGAKPYVPAANPLFFTSTSNQNELLVFPGDVRANIMRMNQMDKALSHLNAQALPEQHITKLFAEVRDRRYFLNRTVTLKKLLPAGDLIVPLERDDDGEVDTRPPFLRRSGWLFPDDGCYYRAEMFSLWFNDVLGYKVPPRALHKIFVFGNLTFPTIYHPHKEVPWVYHVAALVRSKRDNGYLVMDPSTNPGGPKSIDHWITKFAGPDKNTKNIRESPRVHGFLITNRFVYTPNVWNKNDLTLSVFDPQRSFWDPYGHLKAKGAVQYLLGQEWHRLYNLSMNAEALLGHSPPWKAATKTKRL